MPLPGYNTITLPAKHQYDSGEIEIANTLSNKFYAAIDDTNKRETPSAFSTTSICYDGINKALIQNLQIGNDWVVAFKPSLLVKPFMNRLYKVKVYTNLSSTNANIPFALPYQWAVNKYLLNSTDIIMGSSSCAGIYESWGACDQGIQTTPELEEGELTANIGDPGTAYGILQLNGLGLQGTAHVGDKKNFKGTKQYDLWNTGYIGFCIKPNQDLAGFKFRFFIEFN